MPQCPPFAQTRSLRIFVVRSRTLQKTPGVDGLYVYVAPPSFEELEARCRGRLKEEESTIQKRLTWAQDQVGTSVTPPKGLLGS